MLVAVIFKISKTSSQKEIETNQNKTKQRKNSTNSISISELLSQREIESCLSFQAQQQTRVHLKLRGARSRAGQGRGIPVAMVWSKWGFAAILSTPPFLNCI